MYFLLFLLFIGNINFQLIYIDLSTKLLKNYNQCILQQIAIRIDTTNKQNLVGHRFRINRRSIKLFSMQPHHNSKCPYLPYRLLPLKLKKQRIDSAKQSEEHRKPNPQGIHEFEEYSWLPFKVTEWINKKQSRLIKLQTYRYNAKKGKPKVLLFMFHGLNSYIGHGAHLAQYFSHYGITTVGFDHRGFGRSQGREGYADNLQQHLEDSRKFIQLVLTIKQYTDLPRFILGLSMGGMTAYHLTLQQPKLFDGAILMAPALMNSVGSGLVMFTKVLNKLLPDKTKLTKPVYGKATRNPTVTQWVKQDKYAFSSRMSLSTVQMLISTMSFSPNTFPNYDCPFIIVQGGLDKLVCPEVAFELFDKSKTKAQDKQLVFFEDMWHDVWHEQEIWDILKRVTRWIHGRLNKGRWAGKGLGLYSGQQQIIENKRQQGFNQVQKQLANQLGKGLSNGINTIFAGNINGTMKLQQQPVVQNKEQQQKQSQQQQKYQAMRQKQFQQQISDLILQSVQGQQIESSHQQKTN